MRYSVLKSTAAKILHCKKSQIYIIARISLIYAWILLHKKGELRSKKQILRTLISYAIFLVPDCPEHTVLYEKTLSIISCIYSYLNHYYLLNFDVYQQHRLKFPEITVLFNFNKSALIIKHNNPLIKFSYKFFREQVKSRQYTVEFNPQNVFFTKIPLKYIVPQYTWSMVCESSLSYNIDDLKQVWPGLLTQEEIVFDDEGEFFHDFRYKKPLSRISYILFNLIDKQTLLSQLQYLLFKRNKTLRKLLTVFPIFLLFIYEVQQTTLHKIRRLEKEADVRFFGWLGTSDHNALWYKRMTNPDWATNWPKLGKRQYPDKFYLIYFDKAPFNDISKAWYYITKIVPFVAHRHVKMREHLPIIYSLVINTLSYGFEQWWVNLDDSFGLLYFRNNMLIEFVSKTLATNMWRNRPVRKRIFCNPKWEDVPQIKDFYLSFFKDDYVLDPGRATFATQLYDHSDKDEDYTEFYDLFTSFYSLTCKHVYVSMYWTFKLLNIHLKTRFNQQPITYAVAPEHYEITNDFQYNITTQTVKFFWFYIRKTCRTKYSYFEMKKLLCCDELVYIYYYYKKSFSINGEKYIHNLFDFYIQHQTLIDDWAQKHKHNKTVRMVMGRISASRFNQVDHRQRVRNWIKKNAFWYSDLNIDDRLELVTQKFYNQLLAFSYNKIVKKK